jgi:hypothetical protein
VTFGIALQFRQGESRESFDVVRYLAERIARLLIASILQVLQEAGCDLRTWTITVSLRQALNRPQLRWYLEQMVQEQMIFRYEDPAGIVTYSKDPIIREKVLF